MVPSIDIGGGDSEPAAAGRTRLPDDDVHVASERGQQAEQAFQRIRAKVAATASPSRSGGCECSVLRCRKSDNRYEIYAMGLPLTITPYQLD